MKSDHNGSGYQYEVWMTACQCLSHGPKDDRGFGWMRSRSLNVYVRARKCDSTESRRGRSKRIPSAQRVQLACPPLERFRGTRRNPQGCRTVHAQQSACGTGSSATIVTEKDGRSPGSTIARPSVAAYSRALRPPSSVQSTGRWAGDSRQRSAPGGPRAVDHSQGWRDAVPTYYIH